MSRFWLGSVAVELVRHGPAPILLVRPRRIRLPRRQSQPSDAYWYLWTDRSWPSECWNRQSRWEV